jgi:hypothetical protein
MAGWQVSSSSLLALGLRVTSLDEPLEPISRPYTLSLCECIYIAKCEIVKNKNHARGRLTRVL